MGKGRAGRSPGCGDVGFLHATSGVRSLAGCSLLAAPSTAPVNGRWKTTCASAHIFPKTDPVNGSNVAHANADRCQRSSEDFQGKDDGSSDRPSAPELSPPMVAEAQGNIRRIDKSASTWTR
eukprot:scaffold663_cov341-Pavlova_lutheri.AAC.2